jgi:hypothetical protein
MNPLPDYLSESKQFILFILFQQRICTYTAKLDVIFHKIILYNNNKTEVSKKNILVYFHKNIVSFWFIATLNKGPPMYGKL